MQFVTEWMDEKPYPGPPSEDFQYFINRNIRGDVETNIPGWIPVHTIEFSSTQLSFNLKANTAFAPEALPLKYGDIFLFNDLPFIIEYSEYVYASLTPADNYVTYHARLTDPID
jgi:hypothetical protein